MFQNIEISSVALQSVSKIFEDVSIFKWIEKQNLNPF